MHLIASRIAPGDNLEDMDSIILKYLDLYY